GRRRFPGQQQQPDGHQHQQAYGVFAGQRVGQLEFACAGLLAALAKATHPLADALAQGQGSGIDTMEQGSL
ncbi:hypothetical protein, partial [Escherichia coli]